MVSNIKQETKNHKFPLIPSIIYLFTIFLWFQCLGHGPRAYKVVNLKDNFFLIKFLSYMYNTVKGSKGMNGLTRRNIKKIKPFFYISWDSLNVFGSSSILTRKLSLILTFPSRFILVYYFLFRFCEKKRKQ